MDSFIASLSPRPPPPCRLTSSTPYPCSPDAGWRLQSDVASEHGGPPTAPHRTAPHRTAPHRPPIQIYAPKKTSQKKTAGVTEDAHTIQVHVNPYELLEAVHRVQNKDRAAGPPAAPAAPAADTAAASATAAAAAKAPVVEYGEYGVAASNAAATHPTPPQTPDHGRRDVRVQAQVQAQVQGLVMHGSA